MLKRFMPARATGSCKCLRSFKPLNSCQFASQAALEQVALIVLQTGIGLLRLDTIAYAKTAIYCVVQLGRGDGQRSIVEIASTQDL